MLAIKLVCLTVCVGLDLAETLNFITKQIRAIGQSWPQTHDQLRIVRINAFELVTRLGLSVRRENSDRIVISIMFKC